MAGIALRQWRPSPKPATRDERDRAVLATLVRLYEKGDRLRSVGPGDIGKALNWPGLYFDGSSRLQDNLKRLVRAGLAEKVPIGPAHRGNRYKPTAAGVEADAYYGLIAKADAEARAKAVELLGGRPSVSRTAQAATDKAGQNLGAAMCLRSWPVPGPCGDLGGPEEE